MSPTLTAPSDGRNGIAPSCRGVGLKMANHAGHELAGYSVKERLDFVI